MKRNIFRFIGGVLLLSMFIPACTSKFDEINTNPDAASQAVVPPTNVLAFTIRYYLDNMYDVWNDMNEPETYGGHLAKIQYIDEARYLYRPGTVENKWYYIYLTVQNVRNLQEMASSTGNTNLQAVGQVLEAFMMLEATDTWRDIPYSDAFKIKDKSLLPKYDTQENIYPALLKLLQNASTLFQKNEGSLGDGDILFNGDVQKWQQFANSLILRVSMRISGVAKSIAQPAFESIMTNLASNPIMQSNDDNAFFIWQSTSPYQDPWFVDAKTRDDHAVSDVLVDSLKSLSDPRLPIYALPITGDTVNVVYKGFVIGAAGQPSLTMVSRIGTRFRYTAAGFSPMMRSAEVWFHIAEAAKLGWNTGGITAQQAYEKAVTLSLEENGIGDTEIAAYLAGKGKFANTYTQIYLQEWIALFKQGMEAWSLYRRTGVPKLYVAPGTKYTGHNVPPFRYPYPVSEINLNGVNSKPYVAQVVDDFWGKQMWWDTRTGVH